MTLKIVAISDTHERHDELVVPPSGDVVIHSGDATMGGGINKLANFATWFGALPHKHKIFVPGNHDLCFENANAPIARSIIAENNIKLLIDESIVIDGHLFYGSPWQPYFRNWAFNLQRGEELANKWAKIPDDVEVLITHSPPFGILDETPPDVNIKSVNVGCSDLLKRVNDLRNLKAHVFGHIHHCAGVKQLCDTKFINASSCTERYAASNPPIQFEI